MKLKPEVRSVCDGRALITGCSGLAIISKLPILNSSFEEYTYKGSIWDGEALAGNLISITIMSFILPIIMRIMKQQVVS